MKKILLLIGFAFLCSGVFGQRITALDAVTTTTANDLLLIRSGATGNTLSKITFANLRAFIEADSSTVDGSENIWFFEGGDTLNIGITAAGSLNLFDYAARKYPDSLLVTTAEYRPTLTHAGRFIRCNRASQIKVFLPPDSTVNFPIGTVLNFKMDNTGIVSFYKGTGVTRQSKLDSMTMNTQHGWSTWIKRASNKWEGLGDL